MGTYERAADHHILMTVSIAILFRQKGILFTLNAIHEQSKRGEKSVAGHYQSERKGGSITVLLDRHSLANGRQLGQVNIARDDARRITFCHRSWTITASSIGDHCPPRING